LLFGDAKNEAFFIPGMNEQLSSGEATGIYFLLHSQHHFLID
jgi:hypothetical protein